MLQATATEMKNNFGHYLKQVMNGEEIIVTRNGKEVGRFVPKAKASASITDSLRGILSKNIDFDAEKEKALKHKYEITD